MQVTKIIYRFKDSSIPPRFHRSYTIEVTNTTISMVVDSYKDILGRDSQEITNLQFDELVGLLADIKLNENTTKNDGCKGGTTESLKYYNEGIRVFNGRVYHCGGNDYGNLDGDTYALLTRLKSLIPNFKSLLKK